MAHGLLSLPQEVLHCIFTLDDPRQVCGGSEEPSWEEDFHRFVNTYKILESVDEGLKKAQIEPISQCVERLLKTSTITRSPSRNLASLSDHIHRDEYNKRLLLTGSSLYHWAQTDAWRPSCSTSRDNDPVEVSETSGPADQCEDDDNDADEEHNDEPGWRLQSDVTHVLDNGYERHTDVANSNHDLRGTAGAVSLAPRRQLSAKLHCLYGIPIQEVLRASANPHRYDSHSDTALMHTYARSKVYDLRQHTQGSLWGPFLDDGSQDVDWEKMEAIMLLLHHNMGLFALIHDVKNTIGLPEWNKPFDGAIPYSYTSEKMDVPMCPKLPLAAQDPYNVTGTWMRIVCFLDFTELFDFNFTGNPPLPKSTRAALNTEEAIRLITMKLTITKVDQPRGGDWKGLPAVHFKGTSSSIIPAWDPHAYSKIRGEVRWTTWSIYQGEERWRSEGVQIGGIQSARGVLGFWFDKDFDEHGPAGPTAFWKCHDGIEDEKAPPSTNVQHDLHALHVPLY
ncbi:MAG: hypothetical protein Q9163_003272 [Psora crenata]